ncbi:hypothetical protein KIN20_027881 [Parelaphostrongylus tenuis]|uniref:Uncharacterized protein n=1 Tax=Parelaphostrongylus tenuis TaxID=148309 RepID=A0AAD5WEB8_PARTN|nr:hypothetical protein KIN20_027881 [Parelaphostrongylus tenuis]
MIKWNVCLRSHYHSAHYHPTFDMLLTSLTNSRTFWSSAIYCKFAFKDFTLISRELDTSKDFRKLTKLTDIVFSLKSTLFVQTSAGQYQKILANMEIILTDPFHDIADSYNLDSTGMWSDACGPSEH